MTHLSEELRKILISFYTEQLTGVSQKWEPNKEAEIVIDKAISAITELVEKTMPEDTEIQKVIASKHIYVDGHCDTDDFVTIPIIELSKALRTKMLKKLT
jgi:hypothetical protein